MKIPQVTKTHVLAAAERIDSGFIPPRRQSTKFRVIVNGRAYPPKLLLSLAVQEAIGRNLRSEDFSGGNQTNAVFRKLGFVVATNVACERTSTAVGRSALAIARIVVKGKPQGSIGAARGVLLSALGSRWPLGCHAKFILTPGGFISLTFPKHWTGGAGWDSKRSDLAALSQVAEPHVRKLLTPALLRAARRRADILTLGVDLSDDRLQAELVAVVDLKRATVIAWTGKSYPVASQESHLVQVVDLKTHLRRIAGTRVLILGCHDLNMYSERSRANQKSGSRRNRVSREMRELTASYRPTVVLQHPHYTDTPEIWSTAWSGLHRLVPGLKAWASGIAYSNKDGGRPRCRSLPKLLVGTRSSEGVVDIVVKP